MTLDQFLAHLAAHERGKGWTIAEPGFEGQVRRPAHRAADATGDLPWCCPITACAERWGSDFAHVYPLLGLSPDDAHAIAAASDNDDDHDRALRAALLAALGLEDAS